MANAKTYNDLNQATEVNDTDKVALAQSDKQELVTATVSQVAQKVANIVSTDQVTEIVTDLGMGKQIMAQKLQDKGLDVTASDTLTAMANKVDSLDVVGAKEYLISNVVKIENIAYSTGSYGKRIPMTKYFICFTSTSAPYTIGLYGPNADETAMELKSSLVLTDLTSFANLSNMYWTFCSNPKYVLFSNAKQQFMLEISDTAELSLKWTHTVTTSTAEVPVLVSRDGEKYVTCYSTSFYTRDSIGTLVGTSIYDLGISANSAELYVDDDNGSIFGSAYSGADYTYAGNINWTDGKLTLTKFGTGKSLFMDHYGTNFIDIKNKKVIKISRRTGSSSIPYPYFYAYDMQTGNLEYSAPLVENNLIITGSGYAYMCGCLEYDTEDNPLMYTNIGCFKYDILNKQVSIVDTNNATYKTTKVTSLQLILSNNNSLNNNGYCGGIYLHNRIQFLSSEGGVVRNFSTIKQGSTSYGTPVYYNKQICTGLIYKRNTQETLFTMSTWSDADYEAGAYDVDNTKAEVEI